MHITQDPISETEITPCLSQGNPKTGQATIGVATFRKTAHPMNAEQGQGYEHTDVSDTLNVFDNSEARTPVLAVQAVDVYNQTENGDIAPTITAAVGGGNTSGAKVLEIRGGQPVNPNGKIDSYGFKPRQGSKAKGIGFGREISPTIPAGVETAVLIRKNE